MSLFYILNVLLIVKVTS